MIYGISSIIIGDVRESLRAMPADSVHCAVTSPPYWGLRSYLPAGHADKGFEIGSEPTPEAFVETMVDVFREVRRVLHPSGVMGLNIGDSYASAFACSRISKVGNGSPDENTTRPNRVGGQVKEKDLCMMPWRVFMALQADGWYVRSIIVWHKPAPMPESCTDRPTSAWEPIALMSKRPDYFWDAEAIKEAALQPIGEPSQIAQRKQILLGANTTGTLGTNHGEPTRNSRNVWRIASEPWQDPAGVDHFAAFPTEIPRRFVKAGTSEKGCCPACLSPWERVTERGVSTGVNGAKDNSQSTLRNDALRHSGRVGETTSKTTGWRPTCGCGEQPIPCTVLDPFSGTGSTGVAACQLGRNYIGCELFEKYAEMSKRRIAQALNPNTFAHQGDEAPIEGGLFQ